MTRTGFFVLFLTLAALTLGGCSNTIHGMGRDIQNTGRTIDDTF